VRDNLASSSSGSSSSSSMLIDSAPNQPFI
jgi:hypothetical protein